MVEAEAGKVVIGGFKVQEEHCNLMGTLHGGVSATLVDIVRDAWHVPTLGVRCLDVFFSCLMRN